MKPLIIERPEKQSAAQRVGFGLLTLFFWGLFVYFIRPVLTLAAWVTGYWRFQSIMIESHGIADLWHLLLIYGLIILGMGLMLIGWSIYNLFRYGHNEKRIHQPPPVTVEMLGEFFKVDPDIISKWHDSKNLIIKFNADGSIIPENRGITGKQDG